MHINKDKNYRTNLIIKINLISWVFINEKNCLNLIKLVHFTVGPSGRGRNRQMNIKHTHFTNKLIFKLIFDIKTSNAHKIV